MTASFFRSSSSVRWKLHQSSSPDLRFGFCIFSLAKRYLTIGARFAHKEACLPSAGVNAVQVKHDLRSMDISWHFAISYVCGMIIYPMVELARLPEKGGFYSRRNCSRYFWDWRVCEHFPAARCSKNNFLAWEMYNPNFLMFGVSHAFSCHSNGKRKVFIKVAGLCSW